MSIRLLEELDYYKGFINLLKQLTTTDDILYNNFLDIFNSLQISTPIYEIKTYVIEDEKCKKIIATGTIMICQKFIHECGKVAYIEDIVVDENYRNFGYGKKILELLKEIAENRKCYKIILNCSEYNEKYYEKLGFSKKNIQMAKYF